MTVQILQDLDRDSRVKKVHDQQKNAVPNNYIVRNLISTIFIFRVGLNYTAKVVKEEKDDSWKHEIMERVLEVFLSVLFDVFLLFSFG
jgi:hypothetical protein